MSQSLRCCGRLDSNLRTCRISSWPRVRYLPRRSLRVQNRPSSDDRGPSGIRDDYGQATPLAGYYADILGHSMHVVKLGGASQARITARPVGESAREPAIANRSARTAGDTAKISGGGTMPAKPTEPDNCCMSGCVNCVWDMYREELEEWAVKCAAVNAELRGKPASGGNADRPSQNLTDLTPDGRQRRLHEPTAGERVEDAMDSIPVGLSEFMKMEKMLKERRQQR